MQNKTASMVRHPHVTDAMLCWLLMPRRYIVGLGFSGDGNRLVVVTGDNRHTVSVYHWRSRQLISTGVGQNGQPPAVRMTYNTAAVDRYHQMPMSSRVTAYNVERHAPYGYWKVQSKNHCAGLTCIQCEPSTVCVGLLTRISMC